jgi:hypothetical protein
MQTRRKFREQFCNVEFQDKSLSNELVEEMMLIANCILPDYVGTSYDRLEEGIA